jgi:site-specific recombinase XerD
MLKLTCPSLAVLLHRFFLEWLGEQRSASPKTIHAYRDAWRLFLRFTAKRRGKQVAKLQLEDLTEDEVLTFLQHIERDRHASVTTRNCRLAALRSFFSFVAEHEPTAAQQCHEILRIPFKRASRRSMVYLEESEVVAIIAQTDRSTLEGQRDHLLLSLLYNTGARIQEALNLRPEDFHLASPTHVRLLGKGRKERIAPLWPETAHLVAAFVKRQSYGSDEHLFRNRYGAGLTASGFRFRLRNYVKAAAATQPSLSRKKVTPHTFRHTIAVHLVAAGVDVTVIRSWLGHAHLDTTNLYAEANIETQRKALEKADPRLRNSKRPRWKRDADLLAWLDSL